MVEIGRWKVVCSDEKWGAGPIRAMKFLILKRGGRG